MALVVLLLTLLLVVVDASSGSKGVVVDLQASWGSTSLLHEAAEFLVGDVLGIIVLHPEAFFGFENSSECIDMN
jgi:hypothetical protein